MTMLSEESLLHEPTFF